MRVGARGLALTGLAFSIRLLTMFVSRELQDQLKGRYELTISDSGLSYQHYTCITSNAKELNYATLQRDTAWYVHEAMDYSQQDTRDLS